MSLELSFSKPEGITAKTFDAETLLLGDYQISMVDFCQLAMYVLTNTNLAKGDPRYSLVESIKRMKVTEGFPTVIQGKVLKEALRFELPTEILGNPEP